MANVLRVGVQRLLQSPTILALLEGKDVYAVMAPKGLARRHFLVNRVHELREGKNVHAGIAISCFHETVVGIEAMGSALIDLLEDDEAEFSIDDAHDVQFFKVGPDVTGFDATRGLAVRQIEFAVSW